jgi:tetratricopeptide (TPR) repeat protein
VLTIVLAILASLVLGYVFHITYEESLQETRLIVVIITNGASHTVADMERSIQSARQKLRMARILVCERSLCLAEASQPGTLEEYALLVKAGQTIGLVGKARRVTADMNTVRQSSATDYTDTVALVSIRALRAAHCRFHEWPGDYLDCTGAALTVDHYASIQLESVLTVSEGAVVALRQWLAHHQGSPMHALWTRAHFELGQLLEATGDLAGAARHYRIQLGANESHTNYRYYARYSLARIALQQSEPKAANLFLLAMDSGSEGLMRWEQRYYLARLERAAGRYNRCILYAHVDFKQTHELLKRLRELQPLRVEPNIYHWALEEELAYCLWQAGHKTEARAHYGHLQGSQTMPPKVRERIAAYAQE